VALVLTALAALGSMFGAPPGTPWARADPTPHIPKLPTSPTATVSDPVRDEPARALPETTTVCWDPAATRCWMVAGESVCTAPSAPAARPFRVVIGGAGEPYAEQALAECRTQPELPGSEP
jgi:hypothetical protein